MQVTTGKGPFEGPGPTFVAPLEGNQCAFEVGEIGEVAGREKLALDDGEVDFDLVEPAGMDRRVDQNEIGPFCTEANSGPAAAMGGAIVCNEENAMRRAIRFPRHDLSDQALERSDAGFALAPAEQLGAVHVPGREVGQRPGTCVFMLNVYRAPFGGRQRTVFAAPRLDAGLLVSAENVIARPKCSTFPTAVVKIEDAARFAVELWIAREDPGAMTPGPQRILAQPAPEGSAADLGDDAVCHRLLAQFGDRPARQGQTSPTWQLTSQRLDGHNDTGGKSGLVARFAAVPQDREAVRRRSAGATC